MLDLGASREFDHATPDVCSLFMIVFSALLHLKTSPHLLQLFRRMSQSCFVVKLQKTSSDFIHLHFYLELIFYPDLFKSNIQALPQLCS